MKNKNKTLVKNKKNKTLKINGFTLVELVCVMAIFAMILFGALAMVGPVSRLFKNTTRTEAARSAMLSMTGYLEGTLRNANRVHMYVGFDSFESIVGNNNTPEIAYDDIALDWWSDIDSDQRQEDTYGTLYWNTLVTANTYDTDYWVSMKRLGVMPDGGVRTVYNLTAIEYFRDYFYLDNTTTLISQRMNDNYNIDNWVLNKATSGLPTDKGSHLGTSLPDNIATTISRSDVDRWLATGNHAADATNPVSGEFNIYVLGIEDGRMKIKTFDNTGAATGGSGWKDVVNPAYYDAYDYRLVFGEPATEVQNADKGLYRTRHDGTAANNIVWNNLVNELENDGVTANSDYTNHFFYAGQDGVLDEEHGGLADATSTDDLDSGIARGLSPNVNSTFYNTERFAVSVFAKPKPTATQIKNGDIPQFNENLLNTASFKLKAVGNQSMSETVEPENSPQEKIYFGIKQDGIKLDFSTYSNSFINAPVNSAILTAGDNAKTVAKSLTAGVEPTKGYPYDYENVTLKITSMHNMLKGESVDFSIDAQQRNYFKTFDGFKTEWLHRDNIDLDSTKVPNNDLYVHYKESWLLQEWKGRTVSHGEDESRVVLRNREKRAGGDEDKWGDKLGNGLVKVTRYREYVNPMISVTTTETDASGTVTKVEGKAIVPSNEDMKEYVAGTADTAAKQRVTEWDKLNDPTFNTANTDWDWKHSLFLATSETTPDDSYKDSYNLPYSNNMYIVFTLPKEYS